MKADTVLSIADYIKRRLEKAPITIQYKDDPEHTTREELGRYLPKLKGASKEDIYGALRALISEGAVERTVNEDERLEFGSGPEPKPFIRKTVTYTLV